jgi:SAM-dependent methyltransferase
VSSDNTLTFNSYNDEFQTYVDRTTDEVTGSIKEFIDAFLENFDKDATILEIGSGTGRDADYVERLGYRVLRTDAAEDFVKNMAG